MKMKKTQLLALLAVVVLGLGLRLYQLGTLPKILNRDEAALAYNAYLISQTGQDEFGRNLPLTFESFGDYKLPGYIYTLAGLFKVLPVGDLTTRLPSALAGGWLIVAGYFLAKNYRFSHAQALVLALTIALNPVFWFYSRIAFEANVALAIFATAVVLFTRQRPTFVSDLIGAGLTGVAILFYNTPLLLLPFLGLAILISRGPTQPKKWLPIGLILAGLFIGFYFKFNDLTAQKKGITWFNDETTWTESVQHYTQFSGLSQKLFGNRVVFYSSKILPKIGESFSLNFLVNAGGTHPWHSLPSWGHLYLITYLFALAGVALLLKAALTQPRLRGLVLLLFFSLVPSIITVDAPHATRSLLFFFLLALTSVFALNQLPATIRRQFTLIFIIGQILGAGFYGYQYFRVFPTQQPPSLMIGFDQKIQQIERHQPPDQVAIVDPSGYQYILTAWYLKLEPNTFFATVVKQLPDKIGFKYGQQVGRYHFIAQEADRVSEEKILLEWKDNLWQIH